MQTGLGDYIDLSMHDSMISACVNRSWTSDRRRPATNRQSMSEPRAAQRFYRIYRTADDRYLTLAGRKKSSSAILLNALGRSDFIDLCLRGPGPHQAPVIAYFDGLFRGKPLAYWTEWLLDLDVCFGPVQTFRRRCGSAVAGAGNGGDGRERTKAHFDADSFCERAGTD